MYGYSKQIFDLGVLKNGLDTKTVGVKFFNVFGPNEYHKDDMRSVVHKSWGQIRETGKVRLFKSHRPDYTDGGQLRDFVYVKDCVDALWWFLNHTRGERDLQPRHRKGAELERPCDGRFQRTRPRAEY